MSHNLVCTRTVEVAQLLSLAVLNSQGTAAPRVRVCSTFLHAGNLARLTSRFGLLIQDRSPHLSECSSDFLFLWFELLPYSLKQSKVETG